MLADDGKRNPIMQTLTLSVMPSRWMVSRFPQTVNILLILAIKDDKKVMDNSIDNGSEGGDDGLPSSSL